MKFYITFKEFKENYEKDLTEWLNTYIDATEEDYIREIFRYLDIRLSFFESEKDGKTIMVLKNGFLIEKYNDKGILEDYFIKDSNYAYCLENRILEAIYNYYNSQISLGKIKESEVIDYVRFFSCLNPNSDKEPLCYLNEIQKSKIYITPKFAKKFLNANRLKNGSEFDNFMIREECMNTHLYFFSIKSNQEERDWEISFDQEKYTNFGFALRKIQFFLNKRMGYLIKEFQQIKNPLQQNESLPAPFTTSLEWNITKLELAELIEALIANGNIKSTKAQAIKFFSEITNTQIDDTYYKKIGAIKERKKDTTIFLDKLKTTLENKLFE